MILIYDLLNTMPFLSHYVQEPVHVHYRQLVSRAVTQRLHSPSLVQEMSISERDPDAWELVDRMRCKQKIEIQVRSLGIRWGMLRALQKQPLLTDTYRNTVDFVQDVETAESEVHFLSPTSYQPGLDALHSNNAVLNKSGGTNVKCSEPSDMNLNGVRQDLVKHAIILRQFNQARLGR